MVIAMCLPGVQLGSVTVSSQPKSHVWHKRWHGSLVLSNRKNWIQIQALLLLGYVVEVFKVIDCCKPWERSTRVRDSRCCLECHSCGLISVGIELSSCSTSCACINLSNCLALLCLFPLQKGDWCSISGQPNIAVSFFSIGDAYRGLYPLFFSFIYCNVVS